LLVFKNEHRLVRIATELSSPAVDGQQLRGAFGGAGAGAEQTRQTAGKGHRFMFGAVAHLRVGQCGAINQLPPVMSDSGGEGEG